MSSSLSATESIAVSHTQTAQPSELQRKLKSRQLSMIAIGGCIGTGLFLASGLSIHQAGPGGALVAYGIIGVMVYFLMTSLGEMAAKLPTSGSFYCYASMFVDPALGYAMGVNYWFNWAITLAAEVSASALIMKYWFPTVPGIDWSILFLGLIFTINYCSVKGFAETEFCLSWIKVCAVIVFLVIGLLMISGVIGNAPAGLHNWHIEDAPFHGGILSVVGVFMVAGFAFQGTELVGIAAGESQQPEKQIPQAVKQVFWRILLFYILAMTVMSTLIPYNSSQLLHQDVLTSPFTLVFSHTGITFAAGLMNFVILVAVLSAGNSGLYASSRMLWYLAKKGHTPKLFAKLDRRGVPVWALLATTAIGAMAFLSSYFGDGRVYTWLLNASGLSGFITWLGIAISHYHFRKAYVAQGHSLDKLPYQAKWFPFGPILALVLCSAVVIGQDYQNWLGEHFDWHGFVVSYIGIPLFLALWLGYKWRHRTKIIPLQECQFTLAD